MRYKHKGKAIERLIESYKNEYQIIIQDIKARESALIKTGQNIIIKQLLLIKEVS